MKKIGTRNSALAAADGRDASLARGRHKLLYVEDDDDNWHVARLRLCDRYEVVRASTAQQACELLLRHGKEFVAILMDVELRGSEMSGIDLARLLRGRSQRELPEYARAVPQLDVPIIFVTAHGADFSDTKLEQAGGDRIIRKPIVYNALNLALAQVHLDRVLSRSSRER